MLWTLAVIADSGREMYETMVRPLDPDERERLWQDYVRFGELFGLPRGEVPGSHREFRAWWEEQTRLARPAGDRARAGDGAAGRLPPAGAGGGARQPRRPEPHHQGDPAAARARDLRHPLEPRARVELPGDRRRPPPRPARLPPAGCGAAATTSSSTSSPRPSGGAAARRRRGSTPVPRPRRASDGDPGRSIPPLWTLTVLWPGKSRQPASPRLNLRHRKPKACSAPVESHTKTRRSSGCRTAPSGVRWEAWKRPPSGASRHGNNSRPRSA